MILRELCKALHHIFGIVAVLNPPLHDDRGGSEASLRSGVHQLTDTMTV